MTTTTEGAARHPGGYPGVVVAVGVVSAAITALMVGAAIVDASHKRAIGSGYVEGFEGATGVDLLLATGDGQSYAAFARDPALSRPGVFPSDEEAAYRASRPLMGYAAWALSAGRSAWVPGALVALTILGGGIAGGAFAALLVHRGVLPWLGIGVVILPGAIAASTWLLPEVLALGAAACGLVMWERGRRGLQVMALFAVAGLTREVLLLVPLVLLVGTVRRQGVRAAAPLAVPFGSWLVWAAVVRIRIGYWPFEWHADTRAEIPFAGLVGGVGRWDELGVNEVANGAALVLLAVTVVALILIRRSDLTRSVALSFLLVPPFFWTEMWHRWQDFTRVLLPMTAFGGIALLGWARSRSGGPRSARDDAASPAPSPPVA